MPAPTTSNDITYPLHSTQCQTANLPHSRGAGWPRDPKRRGSRGLEGQTRKRGSVGSHGSNPYLRLARHPARRSPLVTSTVWHPSKEEFRYIAAESSSHRTCCLPLLIGVFQPLDGATCLACRVVTLLDPPIPAGAPYNETAEPMTCSGTKTRRGALMGPVEVPLSCC
jgi:hypothetical protein